MTLDQAEVQNLGGTISIINKKIMNAHCKMEYFKQQLKKTESKMKVDIQFNTILAERRRLLKQKE